MSHGLAQVPEDFQPVAGLDLAVAPQPRVGVTARQLLPGGRKHCATYISGNIFNFLLFVCYLRNINLFCNS